MTEVQQRLAAICQRFGVTSLYAFGSRARELATLCVGVEGEASVAAPAEAHRRSAAVLPTADIDAPSNAGLAASFDEAIAIKTGADTSDLDIAVQPQPGRMGSAHDRVALVGELEELFGVGRVDLVLLPEASTFLAVDVIRGELLYCEDEDRQSREELYYLRRAGDLAPLQQERLRALLAGELRR